MSAPRENLQDGEILYKVVINHEEQYSIWPADRDTPPGWKDAGKTGTRKECLDYIGEVWTDMRPRSLRETMVGTGTPPGSKGEEA